MLKTITGDTSDTNVYIIVEFDCYLLQSRPIFEKIMKRYPIFSVQIIYYHIGHMHK